MQRPAVVIPTGGGKTVIFSHMSAEWIETVHLELALGRKVLVIAHRTELIEQAAEKIKAIAPGLRVGIVKANRNETAGDVVVASVQTLASENRRLMIRGVGLLIIDECFPAGTLVGGLPIETLRPGDMVPSFDERSGERVMRPVVAVMSKIPDRMVHVRMTDGAEFACTPNHPIMTMSGWCPAGKLPRGALVLSYEDGPYSSSGRMYRMRHDADAYRESEDRRIQANGSNVLPGYLSRFLGESGSVEADGPDESTARVGAHAGKQSDDAAGSSRENGRDSGAGWSSSQAPGRQWEGDAGAPAEACGLLGLADRSGSAAERWRSSVSLQIGHSASNNDGLRRGRRGIPFLAGAPRIGRETGSSAFWARVADVQVLEPGSDGTYGGVCPDRLVYNVEVAGTHTYLIDSGIVVHNCHHATADTYMAVLAHYGCFEAGGAVAVGFTATMVRGDDKALGAVWQDVVFSRSIAHMIHEGWLVRPHGLLVQVDDLDLAGVRSSRGDYQANDLGEALSASMAPELIGKAIAEHAENRPTILFAPTVASAQIIGDAVASVGRSVGLVHGGMAAGDRKRVLGDFKSGQIDFVSNCMVLTEGFDEPKTSCIVIARPTKQVGLYIQMVGRGLRPDQLTNKADCLVLDVVGASARHALAIPVDLFGEEPKPKAEKLADDGEEDAEEEEVTAAVGLGLEVEEVYATGPLRAEHVDLFHGSHLAWNQTHGGIWFLTAGERYIIIVPGVAIGTYDVIALSVKKGVGKAREVMTDQRDMSYAMAWAEGDVTPVEQAMARKDRGWRAKKSNERQIALAQRRGLMVPTGATSGEVSTMISVMDASRRIDPPTAALIRDRRQHA